MCELNFFIRMCELNLYKCAIIGRIHYELNVTVFPSIVIINYV